jgi:hypothetical protein
VLQAAGGEGGRPDQGAAVGTDREPRACAVALAATVHMALPATSKTNPLRTTRFQSRFEQHCFIGFSWGPAISGPSGRV